MIINDKYLPLIHNRDRFLILYGGASSGKSYFVAQKIIARMLTESDHRILALRKFGTTVKKSIFQELLDCLDVAGIRGDFKINQSIGNYSLTYKPNGNVIYCLGMDDPEKIKSIKGITSMWLEEATEFDLTDIDQLNLRIRGKKRNYVQYILSFNPISEDNEVVKRYIINKDYKNTTVIHSTYKDNLFLSEEDVEVIESYKTTNQIYYDVYCLGIPGVVDKTNKFLYNFNRDEHVSDEGGYQKDRTLNLSFDFNLEPFSCIAYQETPNGLYVFEEIQRSSDIYDMCDFIKANYPKAFYVVTGDRTGYNRTGTVRGKTSYWSIIKKELNLANGQIRLRAKNLDLVQSRILCNAALKFKNVLIDPKCEQLIEEATYASVDDRGELIKDRKKNKLDVFDGFRYALDAKFPELIKSPKQRR